MSEITIQLSALNHSESLCEVQEEASQHDDEEECGRSIDVIVHVMIEDGWRHVAEIRPAG
jgi:hypothetical protein